MEKSYKSLKLGIKLIFSAVCVLAVVVSPSSARADQDLKTSIFSGNNVFSSCASSYSGNTYCWSSVIAGIKPKADSVSRQIATRSRPARASLTQRAAAMALSLIVEFTTAQSFNEIKIN